MAGVEYSCIFWQFDWVASFLKNPILVFVLSFAFLKFFKKKQLKKVVK